MGIWGRIMKEHTGKFYTIGKLATVTGTNPNWIRYLKWTKKIPFFQESPGSKILIPYDRFLEFLENNTNSKEEI